MVQSEVAPPAEVSKAVDSATFEVIQTTVSVPSEVIRGGSRALSEVIQDGVRPLPM